MGWERRKNQRYYYRKKRIGKQVISEYGGAGALGEIMATLDEHERTIAQYRSQAYQEYMELFQEIDCDIYSVEVHIRCLLRAVLISHGYHQHKGQWRKRR